MTSKRDQIREIAENDTEAFIRLIHPQRVLGQVHRDVLGWWDRSEKKSHQLLLLPRDHQKSALVAYRVARAITKDPTLRFLYISATANLAQKQLKFIKDILTHPTYRYYWPEMINEDEGKREKWTEFEISVDHPRRKAEAVRDPTIFTAGLTTNIVGMHSDKSVFDDVVVPDNAYTEEGRNKVLTQYSALASIEGSDSEQWVVGTRYHPKDLYQTMMDTTIELLNESGDLVSNEPLYEVFERQVEERGDGYGQFLWPRQQRSDGKWFGFNAEILARKRAQYADKTQFRAQYYNDPNDITEAPIDPSLFQYYDKNHLSVRGGNWYFQNRKLNVFASIDFAYTLGKKSDFTAIVVVGLDAIGNYYVLDIYRFKTDQISEYFKQIMAAYKKWSFRKLRAEVTAAQSVIVKDLKENYIRKYGLALAVDDFTPTRNEGTKNERVMNILQPKYENRQIWHYKDGECQTLEEELIRKRPSHDDVKDALASAIDLAVPPSNLVTRATDLARAVSNSRFGGFGTTPFMR